MAAMEEVIPTSVVRQNLSSILKTFSEKGIDAKPVIFGSYRKAQAAIIPYEHLEIILDHFEDLEIAAVVRERMNKPGKSISFDHVIKEVGISAKDLGEFESSN